MKNDSELILNPDGSVYHLHLKPEHVADTVLVAGDSGRVSQISAYFDEVEYRIENREFCTHTGTYKGKRFTVLSTGIGADNIDIVLNELDAAVNMDLSTGEEKKNKKRLDIVRLGTSGSLRKEVKTGSFLVTSHAIGMDGLLNFYDVVESERERELASQFSEHMKLDSALSRPYARFASEALFEKLLPGNMSGITVTAPGFYAPQGRKLRLNTRDADFHDRLRSFSYENTGITNFEMEASALFGLGQALGHRTAAVCTIIANRVDRSFLEDYKKAVNRMISDVLDKLTT